MIYVDTVRQTTYFNQATVPVLLCCLRLSAGSGGTGNDAGYGMLRTGIGCWLITWWVQRG
jgi:hypothetical protein